MKLLVFCFLVSSCYAIDFNCLKGPDYWCSNFANAQKCGKITECFLQNKPQTNKVVQHMANNGDNSETCKMCEELVTILEKKIPSFTKQQFVDFLLNNACSKLKPETKMVCDLLVDQFGPAVYDTIKNNSTPAKVCGYIKVCKSDSLMEFMAIFSESKSSSPELCAKCKEVFKVLESLFSKVTPDEIKMLLDNLVCSQLPSEFQGLCKTLVDGYVSQVYELIKTFLDGDRMCPFLHFCPNNSTKNSKISSWNCDTCVDVVSVLKKDLVNVPTTDIEALIKNMACSQVPFFAKGICDDAVDKYVPAFMNDLHSSLTPQQICSKNKLCSSRQKPLEKPDLEMGGPIKCELCEIALEGLKKFISSTTTVDKFKSFIETKICKHFKSLEAKCSNVVEKYGDLVLKMITNHMDSKTICKTVHACKSLSALQTFPTEKVKGIECEACHLAITQLKKIISDPDKETIYKNFLKNEICSFFGSDKIQCQQLVDEYFQILMNFVISQLDVDKICQLIDMCPKTVTNTECDICEAVVNEVINTVLSDHSEQVAQSFITTKICPHLGFIKTECVNITNSYLPILFSLARSTLNSKIICEEFKLCSVISQKKVEFLAKTTNSNTLKCEICQLVVNETKQLLTNPDIQTAVENFLKNEICSHFGAKKQECINDINQYYSLVVNLIIEFLNPGLCNEFRLCASSNIQQPMMEIVKSKKITHCKLCSKFYKYLQTIANSNPKTETVLDLVILCNELTKEDKSKCLSQFRNFDAVIKHFNKSKSMGQFCQMTKMCSRSKKRNIGADACTWGPSFWCISRQHALACGPGAVKHCEMNAWTQIPSL